jgi:hypothetical protein
VTELQVEAGEKHGPAGLTVILWKREVDRKLYLCDAEGVALHELPAGVQAPGLHFTAYLKSPLIRELEGQLLLADLEQEHLSPLIEAARQQLKRHFDELNADRARDVIKNWQTEEVYPYVEPPTDGVETVKRQLFEVVAYAASSAVNSTKDRRAKRLSLSLLQQAMENGPTALRHILDEVLKLPPEQVKELDSLLEHTTLASVITASRRIADRLEFLRGLEYLLFDPEMKKALKERSQLHKIVRNEPWLFGEEFALAVDDRSLNQVLAQHLKLLGDEVVTDDQPVLDSDGRHRIVDLMFAGSMEQRRQRREHLVVELKRPSVRIGSDELTQIEKYAFAVIDDPRFNTTEVEWDFWIVSDEMDPYAKQKANQDGLPQGVTWKGRNDAVRIRAVQWGELIEDSRHRLKFVQQQLNYIVTNEGAMDYLRRAHQQFLPQAESSDKES